MAFNGTGTFNRLYSWVADAANSLFISSTRMDAEMDGMASGLSNCITRDGQSPPTADIPMGGHKITGLATGTLPGDAATTAQVTASVPTGGWAPDSLVTASYISATQFRIPGADWTYRYHSGMRVWMRFPTVLGTIISSSYSAPDTIVTVACDVAFGGVVPAGITQSIVGLIEYLYPSYLSPRTAVQVKNAGLQTLATGAYRLFPYDSEDLDVLGEFDNLSYAHRPKYPGYVRVSGAVVVQAQGTAMSQLAVSLYKNGVVYNTAYEEHKPMISGNYYSAPFSSIVSLSTVGDYLQVYVLVDTVAVKAAVWSTLAIDRIV